MPAPLVRRFLRALIGVAVLMGVAALSLPWIASTQIVRSRIAQELAILTGYDVTLVSSPEIRVWPTFRYILNDVRFYADRARPPVLEAERIEANLLAFASLGGHIVFSSLSLERPILRVNPHPDFGYMPDLPASGRVPPLLGLLEGAARGDGVAEIRLDKVSFNDGRVVLAAEAGGGDVVSSLSGTIGWPGTGRPASLNASGIWRGEQVSIAAYAASPEAFTRGDPTPFTFSVQSSPLALSFNGRAIRTDRVRVEGALSTSTPSLRRLLEWSNAGIAPGAGIGAVSLAGTLSASADRQRIDGAELSLDGNAGLGALEFATDGPVPSMAGTLAFDRLDLGAFLSAFEARPTGSGGEAAVFDLDFTRQLNLDLRLSATRATAGRAELTNVAATAQIKPDLAAFDISDATAFGGVIQGGLRVDRRPEGDVGEVRISANGIDWGAAASVADWPLPLPRARGSATLHLLGPVENWTSSPRTVTGSVTANFEAGTLERLNLQGLVDRSAAGFFPLSEISDGSLAIQGAELKVTIGNATAKLDLARAWTAREVVSLAGVVPYVARSLALGGTVAPIEAGDPARAGPPLRRFFVGGSWGAPFVSVSDGENDEP